MKQDTCMFQFICNCIFGQGRQVPKYRQLQYCWRKILAILLVSSQWILTFGVCVMQIRYGLPYCAHLPLYEYGSRVPKPMYESKPRTRMVGSRDPYEYWGRWHSFGKTYLIYIIAQVLWKSFWYPLTGILCQRWAVWVAAEIVDLWSGALHTPTATTTTNTSAFNDTSRHIQGTKTVFNKFCCSCRLHSP